MGLTTKQRLAASAFENMPVASEARLLAAWRKVVEAFDGAPPMMVAFSGVFRTSPEFADRMEAVRVEWFAKRGLPVLPMTGEPPE